MFECHVDCTRGTVFSCYNCRLPDLPLELSVEDVKRLMAATVKPCLIDVREPEEFAVCKIEGAELIPMRTIPASITQLEDHEEPLIFFCHHGVRSLQVAAWLREHGVENAQSMAGGIDAWSRLVDPAIPRY